MRAVIYVRGPDVDQQKTRCLTHVEHHQHEVAGFAQDPPGSSDGWAGALRMVESGEADYILVGCPEAIPRTSR